MGPLEPGYKPSLVMIFTYLGDIHAKRHQKTNRKTDLDEAIWATRLALGISTPDNPITPTLLNNLANILWRCYRCDGQEDDLQQALFYGLQALDSPTLGNSDRAAVLGTLGAIRASLYDCRRSFQDLQDAISTTRTSIDIARQCERVSLTTLCNNLGTYLWMQHRLTSRREDLDESVVSFAKALECPTENTSDRVTCLINYGQVLAQRYHRTGELEDLSCALESAQEAMRLDPQNGDLAVLLNRLDRFVDRRRELTAPVHQPNGHWNTKHASKKLLTLYIVFISVMVYAYNLRTEILLCVVAFWSGIFYHLTMSRRHIPGQRSSMENAFAPVSFLREHFDSLGRSNKYTPKVLAVPLIPVPFASSLRGIQISDFSAYSSSSFNQRRQSMHSAKSEGRVKTRASGHQKGGNGRVHRGRHRRHSHISRSRGAHKQWPAISITTSNALMGCESSKDSLSPMARNAPQVEIDISRNETNSSGRTRGIHSDVQRFVGADSGYWSPSAREREGMDMHDKNKHRSFVSPDGQHHRANASPSSYSQFAPLQNTRSPERVSSPLVPSQSFWAKPGAEYSEHKIWDEQVSSPDDTEHQDVRVIRQGRTDLQIGTNSGLAMGNISSTRAEVAGYVNYGESKSQHRHSFRGELFQTSKSNDIQNEVILQEEEVEIVPSPEVSDFQGTNSPGPKSTHNVDVQAQEPLTSIVDDLMRNQAARVKDVDAEGAMYADQEPSIDLVDQLARLYVESSSL